MNKNVADDLAICSLPFETVQINVSFFFIE